MKPELSKQMGLAIAGLLAGTAAALLIAILSEDANLLSPEASGRRIYEDDFGARRTRGLTPHRSLDSLPFS